MAFGSPEPSRDLEGSVLKSLQLIVTELQTRRQAKSQLPGPQGVSEGLINKVACM